MKKSNYIHVVVLVSLFCGIYADPRIVLFFQPEPMTDAEKMSAKLKKPGKLAKYTAQGIVTTSLVEGIIASYGGYVTVSDYNGELSFPRKHQKNTVVVVVTPEIVPVALFESTIMNWQRVPDSPAAMYKCELMYDSQKSSYYWQTQDMPLSEDMSIPLAAIIISAKPKNIRMEIGNTPTNETGNLVVPTMYVKKGINILNAGSYILTIRHLFKPIQTEENREALKILTQIVD